MYIPAHFKETTLEVLHALMREYRFATLISVLDGEPFATHLPILLDADRSEFGTLVGHMARANPHWHAFEPDATPSLVIFQGPHAYISPSWYAAEQAVPTWNYTVVHAYGRPTVIEDPLRVRALLDETVETFESRFSQPWSTATQTEDYISGMARGIVAFEMLITRLEGKRKLSQNRPVEDAHNAAKALQSSGDAVEDALARLMLDAAGSRT
ncbi:MAG: FMN-binding negative transcriptional regulator [Chloroflexi bacterium]|nr:FMN-binding negative transcriptional regulator [Chloroflexota bacterium]MBV9892699.1 FMN-binding negative transcriptional regulator [Chloroflexota bacterium]